MRSIAIYSLICIFLISFFCFNQTSFGQTMSQQDISVEVYVDSGVAPPPPPPPGGFLYEPLTGQVVFLGKAYPDSYITILKNDIVISIFQAGGDGSFQKEINAIAAGSFNFSLQAQDSEGRQSPAIGFPLTVAAGMMTTVSGIFFPPTITAAPDSVVRGDKVNISGQSFPASRVTVFISAEREMVRETTADTFGHWNIQIGTGGLEERTYPVKSQAFFGDGEQSPFSKEVSFSVLPREGFFCQGADLNFDSRVDIVDFSILLYFWGEPNPENRCADINSDGIVDIFDFSIMMYWWT